MSAQDNTEHILRSLHVLLSKAKPYEYDQSKVIVDRQQMADLLTLLNKCMYDIMDEYELTQQSRDKAERDFKRQGEQIIEDANHKAEDVYAASVMYTDEALSHIQEIIREANVSVQKIYSNMNKKLKEQERIVRTNQSELKSQLHDLVDTEKYLKLIEERNKEIQKEKDKEKGKPITEPSIYANRKTEIKINQEYFDKLGIALEQEAEREAEESLKDAVEAEIRINLDADYFKWKEQQDAEQRQKILNEKSDGIQGVLKDLTFKK
ncbi:MAG: hypothetical protein IKJ01_02620 [Lachnospiraceae bacterium]|nr:hypothetical protein [Lachnospiraceae bacterium]